MISHPRTLPIRCMRVCLLLLHVGLVSGCAALPWPSAPRAFVSDRLTCEGLLDLRGVAHVHTRRSHDSRGTLGEVIAAAQHTGLDWVAFSEHRRGPRSASEISPAAAEPSLDHPLVLIPGWEVSGSGGSILLIGVDERPPRFPTPQVAIDWAHGRGGLAFAGHIERSRLLRDLDTVRKLDGTELVNLHAEIIDRKLAFALAASVLPPSRALRLLLHVRPENIEAWENAGAPGGIIAGVDAHAKFRLFGRYGTLDRYRHPFRAATTHVHSERRDQQAILQALRQGRSYVAFEGLAPVNRFEFSAGTRQVDVCAPHPATFRLICDGLNVEERTGQCAKLAPPPEARRCRVEAYLTGRLWIATAYREIAPRIDDAASSACFVRRGSAPACESSICARPRTGQ